MVFTIDIDENKWDNEILKTLLIDRTTNRNIIWGTNDYEALGSAYNSHLPILVESITGHNDGIIKPRILKTKEDQGNRTKAKAEVFTPSWVCNAQNNLIDQAWFEAEIVFNVENKNKTWTATREKIKFHDKKNKSWKDYVDERRLEITCGEAPYLVSRYDSVTGESIELYRRIGLLDRKLRIVSENTETEEEWLKWSQRAFESIYGFEFQGDSLLLARENLLATYCDYMQDKLKRDPTKDELLNIAKIISWNIWQMDGLTFTIPYENVVERTEQINLFDDEGEEKTAYCIIKDWRAKKNNVFKDLLKRGKNNE